MKGLTHFISGIAAASFIPAVVHRSASPRSGFDGAESSFLLALAGLYAILPDTLDFKLGRFFETADVDVFPDPDTLDAQTMAETLAQVMDAAWVSGRPMRIQFHTLQLSADRWQQYRIAFHPETNAVSVQIGTVVTTSQVPFPGTAPENNTGRAMLNHARLLPGGARGSTVDIMSGPMYGFRRMPGTDHLHVDFLPWHRTWSHSYVLGALLALPLWGIAALLDWHQPWMYPLVAFIGFATHITEDLTGHMGGSLIWPFMKERCRGLCLFHAANPDANFVTDWLALVIILWNLDRFGEQLIPLPASLYFLFFLFTPFVFYFLPRTRRDRNASEHILPVESPEERIARRHDAAGAEIASEAEE
ncbi:metal-dependent hydrolase [bacterium]|nr:metal-dependent hydrolase [candidate division CSSED10-310 bacterium]